jgi:putative endonuclease
MYYVYVLKSSVHSYYYTGFSHDLKKRVLLHNQKLVTSTKPYAPFELIYYEACIDENDAYLREKYLKTRLGKIYLKKRLKSWFLREKK